MLISLKNINQNTLIRIATVFLFFAFSISLSAQQSETYEGAIKTADKLYKEKKYIDAKSYYQLALRYKKGDEYANAQIITIVETLKSQMGDEDEYYDIIDLADVLWEEKAYDKALQQYLKALEVIPGDEYARQQVDEINRRKTEERLRKTMGNSGVLILHWFFFDFLWISR